MARFMVKASEYKNVCKAVNDRKLAELKKEIIEILKKQDEKEFKKAVDLFESQEMHYTHLEKSITGKWVEKAGYGVGTVRIWKGKKYKKIAPGKWARVFDKEGRGTNIAIGKLIARVNKIDNAEDLLQFVMENKQRFVDEDGKELSILDKVRAAVDTRNEKLSGESSTYVYGVGENVNRAKNEMFSKKDKIKKEEADLHKVSRKLSQIPTTELKQEKARLERAVENKTRSKRDSLNNTIFRESNQEKLDAINKELEKRSKEKPAEKKEADYSKMSEDELNELNKKLRQTIKEKDYGEADEEIEQINKISKQKIINSYKTREKHTLQHVEGIEQKKKIIADSKAIVEKDLARKEKQRAKESYIAKKNQMADEINELKYMKAAFEQLENEVNSESQNSDSDIERAKDKIKQYAGKKINSNEISDIKILDDGERSGFFTFEFKSGNDKYKMTYDSGFGGEKGGASIKKIESEESDYVQKKRDAKEGYWSDEFKERNMNNIKQKIAAMKEDGASDKKIKAYLEETIETNTNDIPWRERAIEEGRIKGNQANDYRDTIQERTVRIENCKELLKEYESESDKLDAKEEKRIGMQKQLLELNRQRQENNKNIKNLNSKLITLKQERAEDEARGNSVEKYDKEIKDTQKEIDNLLDDNYSIENKGTKIANELNQMDKDGVKKSFVDDFVIDMFIDEDVEKLEEEKEEESLFDDYSAEQPGLFNSTAMKVQEAMNRCNIL
jgi:chromosome segregation ATPase